MFQWVILYAFHDIKHIGEPYFDDFPSHLTHRQDHIGHPMEIFLRCMYYNIRLNPHKCIFFVESGILLDFIVSKHGIRVDPFKFKFILTLPPPNNLIQVQSFQGKEKFLHRLYAIVLKLIKDS
jgi:hypothetical protein